MKSTAETLSPTRVKLTVEVPYDELAPSLDAAYQDMVTLQGSDPESWRWGALHNLMLEHGTLGQSDIPPIEALFSPGSGG